MVNIVQQVVVDKLLRSLTPTPQIQSGLVPIGNGFYATPDTPADPEDCLRYPNSIFCGTGVSAYPVSLGISKVEDECNLGIQIEGSLAFISLPAFQIVSRAPNCRPKDSAPPTDYTSIAKHVFDNVPPGCHATIGFAFWHKYYNYHHPKSTDIEITQGGISDYQKSSNIVDKASQSLTIMTGVDDAAPDEGVNWTVRYQYAYDQPPYPDDGSGELSYPKDTFVYQTYYLTIDYYGGTEDVNFLNRILNVELPGRDFTYANAPWKYEGLITDCGAVVFPPGITPPPPPPPNRNCCMSCCPQNNDNDDLLRALLSKVNKLSKVVGVDDYPASLPKTFIHKDPGWFGTDQSTEKVSIPSLTQFFGWYVQRFDEIMGQFEIPIEIKNNDPNSDDTTPVGIKLPNIAESIAEMMGLLLQTAINSEQLVNITTRTLIETGSAKQQGFKTYMGTQAMIDYLGFKHENATEKLGLTFTPGQGDFGALLKETEVDVIVPQMKDKTDLHTVLFELLHAAAITRAVHWRKLDKNIQGQTNADGSIVDRTAASFSSIIQSYSQNAEIVNNKVPDPVTQADDFDKFITEAEIGFTDIPGVTDAKDPYGRSFSQRPQIKRLGNTSPPTTP